MATILVLVHEYDTFHAQSYLVQGLFPHWIEAGHVVAVHEGTEQLPDADVVLLHVDLTVVPEAYMEVLARYPKVLNGATANIAKRSFSEHLVLPGDGYAGAVIVKTDANSGGFPERHHAAMAQRRGLVAESPRVFRGRYPVFPSPAHVPAAMQRNPALVVEKFLPERDARGFYLRTWIFLGDRERCNRVLGQQPVVKGEDVIAREPIPVPDELRAWRRRLGFDYGKFDFALHEGRLVLYDVNRTPTVPANLNDAIAAGNAHLAPGIDVFCR